VQYGFTVAGLLALGYCLTVFLDAKFFESRESRNFARQLRRDAVAAAHSGSPVQAVTPVVKPRDGDIIGRLEIPRIGVSVMVVEGVKDGDLKRAAGHIPGTPLPGEPGNVGIAAHRDTFFRPLRSIHRNDVITVSTLRGAYRYRVVSTRIVKPEEVQVLNPLGRDTLTLVTCFPFYYIGSAPSRFIVRADRLPGVGRNGLKAVEDTVTHLEGGGSPPKPPTEPNRPTD
jgi:sortase A